MTTFPAFDLPPGLGDELPERLSELWSAEMTDHASQFAFTFARYFDPTTADAPPDARKVSVIWSASPARLLGQFNDVDRWERADATRDEQDEYCEWRTKRDENGSVTAVVFTTEVPEYWSLVAEHEPNLLVEMYRRWVDPAVQAADLFDSNKNYLGDNQWNHATSEHITHLRQGSNTLLAAIRLAAEATVQRVDATGNRVTDRRELVVCGRLGEPLRNSDPQIADIVNDAVAAGSTVSLANPLGLYLDGVQLAGFVTPDGADANSFWTIERGQAGHVVRARFEVPVGHGYQLSDCTLDGRRVDFGAQVADKVRVRLDALVAPATSPLTTKSCGQ